MGFKTDKEYLAYKQSVSDFLWKEVDPLVPEMEETNHIPKDVLFPKFREKGLFGLIVPEEYGGMGLDFGFVMVLLEEFGRGLLPEPWISNVLLGGNLILLGGSDPQKQEILPEIVSGDLMITVAYLEDDGRYDTNFCGTSARREGDRFSLSGKKIFVLDGLSADMFVVSARTSGDIGDNDGITLFMVSPDKDGVEVTPIKTMDGRNACILELRDVLALNSNIIGDLDKGRPLLSEALDQATAGLCAEMVGGMQASLDLTVAYLSERAQFGKPIGSFQAVQHMLAEQKIGLAAADACVRFAAWAIDELALDEALLAAHTAKAIAAENGRELVEAVLQVHGGMGMTWECDVHRYLRRVNLDRMLLGDENIQYAEIARLRGRRKEGADSGAVN